MFSMLITNHYNRSSTKWLGNVCGYPVVLVFGRTCHSKGSVSLHRDCWMVIAWSTFDIYMIVHSLRKPSVYTRIMFQVQIYTSDSGPKGFERDRRALPVRRNLPRGRNLWRTGSRLPSAGNHYACHGQGRKNRASH